MQQRSVLVSRKCMMDQISSSKIDPMLIDQLILSQLKHQLGLKQQSNWFHMISVTTHTTTSILSQWISHQFAEMIQSYCQSHSHNNWEVSAHLCWFIKSQHLSILLMFSLCKHMKQIKYYIGNMNSELFVAVID